jgi:hypothetical protein
MVMTRKAIPFIVLFGMFLMCESHGAVAATTSKNDCFGILGGPVTVTARVSVWSRISPFTKMTVLALRHDAPVVCILFTQPLSIRSGRVTLAAKPVCFCSHSFVIMTMDTLPIVVVIRMCGMREGHVSPASTTGKYDYCRICRDLSLLPGVILTPTAARTSGKSHAEK